MSVSGLEIHHEYLTTIIQTESAKYFMGIRSKHEVCETIRSVYGSALFWSNKLVWADSSHKLTWLIDPLVEVFPDAKFVNITRDGRKVSGSFFRKLPHEIYEPSSIKILEKWLAARHLPEPPAEKRYWWNVPQEGHRYFEVFKQMDQFERCCYHWAEANRTARMDLIKYVSVENVFTAKLEDLVASHDLQNELAHFIGLDCFDALRDGLRTPKHVLVPKDEILSSQQLRSFTEIASDEMKMLGYDLAVPEYSVSYK